MGPKWYVEIGELKDACCDGQLVLLVVLPFRGALMNLIIPVGKFVSCDERRLIYFPSNLYHRDVMNQSNN